MCYIFSLLATDELFLNGRMENYFMLHCVNETASKCNYYTAAYCCTKYHKNTLHEKKNYNINKVIKHPTSQKQILIDSIKKHCMSFYSLLTGLALQLTLGSVAER
jgi:hypothetical protein